MADINLIRIFHPKLKRIVEVPVEALSAYKKTGWDKATDAQIKKADDEKTHPSFAPDNVVLVDQKEGK